MKVRVLKELRFGHRVFLCLVTFPFQSHAEMIEEAEKLAGEMLWSHDPNQAAAAAAMKQHPKKARFILHLFAVFFFLVEMLAALLPFPKWHRMWRGFPPPGHPDQESPHYFLEPPHGIPFVRAWTCGVKWLRIGLSLTVEDMPMSREAMEARLRLVEHLAEMNTRIMATQPIPKLADSGVQVRSDKRMLAGDVGWITQRLVEDGIAGIDIDSFVAWRVAELRATGVHAVPTMHRSKKQPWTLAVRLPDGSVELPDGRISGLPAAPSEAFLSKEQIREFADDPEDADGG